MSDCGNCSASGRVMSTFADKLTFPIPFLFHRSVDGRWSFRWLFGSSQDGRSFDTPYVLVDHWVAACMRLSILLGLEAGCADTALHPSQKALLPTKSVEFKYNA